MSLHNLRLSVCLRIGRARAAKPLLSVKLINDFDAHGKQPVDSVGQIIELLIGRVAVIILGRMLGASGKPLDKNEQPRSANTEKPDVGGQSGKSRPRGGVRWRRAAPFFGSERVPARPL
jgi:hypothetical protein